ncbi:unnamed protein product [Brassicogethes aeneus]|uniref:Rho GTPase-activating protein 21 n=1 Tax=Brassicogethes aeneus TaxID=1431903 RepID=A0A9P0FJE8_BRAAE|nr:unnamed protein product [Brassicogethes aeneus]
MFINLVLVLQETFQRGQEVQESFSNLSTGIIPLPRGSRGPKSLYLKRDGQNFGFTLRHFIVYPPDGIEDQDDRHALVGALHEPMDTIFVKKVHQGSPAQRGGLQYGDRLVAVNHVHIKGKSYTQVVQLIANSPEYLHLLVVPKEDDVIQRFFSDTAHCPASNQPASYPESPYDKVTAQKIIAQRIHPNEYRADPQSWRALQQLRQPYYHHPEYGNLVRGSNVQQQRSADSLLYDYRSRIPASHQQGIYEEIHPHEVVQRQQQQHSKAQPQVPLYRKMGRRASEGNALEDDAAAPAQYYYDEQPVYAGLNRADMKAAYKSAYMPEASQMAGGCRLSMEVGRRESTSSLASSSSTLTGHETDDSKIIERIRNSFQQKEKFLRAPFGIAERGLVQREFYGRPKKLEKTQWPPAEESPTRTTNKPNHQNFVRVKNDIENERDLQQPSMQNAGGMANDLTPRQKGVKSPNDKNYRDNLDRIQEASVAPSGYDNIENINGSQSADDDRGLYPHIVHKRTRDFESGKPLPDDDPMSNRIDFMRNELARISSKKLVPNVNERAQEYEVRAVEPRRDNSGTSTNSGSTVHSRKVNRDARSLDSSGSNTSSSSIHDDLSVQNSGGGKKLSGNVIISSGSKYIHCPPPSEQGKSPADISGYELINKQRARSNSAESWVAALGGDDRAPKRESKRISRQDAMTAADRNKQAVSPNLSPQPLYADLPPLIPEPVERLFLAPAVSITPAPPSKPVGPNQLDLEVGGDGGPVRPLRHLKAPPHANQDSPLGRQPSPVWDDKPIVVRRRSKNTNIADDERVTRRESYLKATEGGRVDFRIEHSDGDVSPQQLRSNHRRYRRPYFTSDIHQLCKLFEDASAFSSRGSVSENSSSSVSLDRDKVLESPSDKDHPSQQQQLYITREGSVLCKILEIDGKRATDRSWKQVWAVLKGPRLFLYKDKHHQSPLGSSDVVDHSLAAGVDMRTSVVRVAEDYTKRKNVLRVSSVKPCRSEFLVQTEELGDWVTALQEQVATTTEAEAKLNHLNANQQAVPQTNPASTTIQVQGSHLSPQLGKNKNSSSRNRSPTGQSPVSKSRKPSHNQDPATSPKSKTWAGRMLKKFQGANAASSPTESMSTFGIPIENCLCGNNRYIPKVVETCTNIVEEKGLNTIGIYRVPGNNASITALTDEINRSDDIPMEDTRWNDVNVVSSILKSYFRKMPDSLITVKRYPSFIEADKIEDPEMRMMTLRRLVKSLPAHNYETLKHIIRHLNKVIEKSDVNKMDPKNLAIVFGPTIIRSESDSMESMVNNMTNQCKIVETLLTGADFFFSDCDDLEHAMLPPLAVPDDTEYIETGNPALLLENIAKVATSGGGKEKFLSSIISAAQRKKKASKQMGSSHSKEEVTTPTSPKSFAQQVTTVGGMKEVGCAATAPSKFNYIPKPVTDFEASMSAEEKLKERLNKFHRDTEKFLSTSDDARVRGGNLSSSASNVNQTSRLSLQPADMLMKTHSASNVYARMSTAAQGAANVDPQTRNSLNSNYRMAETAQLQQQSNEQLLKRLNNASVDYCDGRGRVLRRGSSVENVNSSSLDLNANGGMKKVKYENESEMNQRSGSLDSLNKQSADGDSDLLRDLTKAYDQIKQKHSQHNLLSGHDLPYADASPDKPSADCGGLSDKENIPGAKDLYKNPSLHKNHHFKLKEVKYKDKEKDEDTTATMQHVPDNERNLAAHNNKLKLKLKRSESLNKPERTAAQLSCKLKRSESLNKAGDRLKRSDSLTKNEKTESNNNKRRELSTGGRKSKENAKYKRKNGMPDRSIKRRHTVGGTKDPDKVTYFHDNKCQEEESSTVESSKERSTNLRTSSPDLSSTRRERLCLEINLVGGPENMVVALRQHLVGPRPQSFPDSVFKVPLESHV